MTLGNDKVCGFLEEVVNCRFGEQAKRESLILGKQAYRE